ncbi:hypothetical protein SAMN04488078_1003128 [Antarctobacter heliothermus]|uniref:Uncharacterized protein n=1 Tax=Antarctobacter heliothermus TaxID=74033 RepID=A0A239BHN7_9RHOB|nr:hypothetical protein [Antarctobacter heliothermus]SNS07316.1 hypothetical protein SAMN04488078_1003128 [Antarctobacter heliothermus]
MNSSGAARAALAGLEAVEAVGRGAIGGFVSLSAILPDGSLHDLGVQRGGAQAMLADPSFAALAEARLAVLMSSGPDRPEPLSQFTPCAANAGLMTGHRLPNMPGPDGQPPNLVALQALREGRTPQDAISLALDAAPDLDAGLIAISTAGEVALGNSASVAARDDIGQALVVEPDLSVAVLHNSILPHEALADLAVSAIRDRLAPRDGWSGSGSAIGLSVHAGPETRALIIDPDSGAPLRFVAAGKEWLRLEWEGCPVRRGDPVIAGGRTVGRVIHEAYCILRDGTVTSTRGGDLITWTAGAGT